MKKQKNTELNFLYTDLKYNNLNEEKNKKKEKKDIKNKKSSKKTKRADNKSARNKKNSHSFDNEIVIGVNILEPLTSTAISDFTGMYIRDHPNAGIGTFDLGICGKRLL